MWCVCACIYQSLELDMEMGILAEMTNQKLRKNLFSFGKNWQAYFFFMKIKMMDLWMQIEGTKMIFIMKFSVQIFSSLPPECLKLHRF